MPAPKSFATAENELHRTVSAVTGLTDFGDPDEYRPGLLRLLAALDSGPRYVPGGKEHPWGSLIGTLTARAYAEHGWREHPQSLQHTIRRPLIVTGMPRTGTTALHKLLSMDPQFQGIERWLTAFPMPRPPRATWEANPQYQSIVAGLEAFFAAAPQLRAAHNMVADEVDECLEVMKANFCSNWFGSSMRIPDYDDWWMKQDERSSYRRYAKVLRLIGSNEPEKPWLLKNPGHIHHLDVLLETFPDACIVQTHRDPIKALPSLCSVLLMVRRMLEGDAANLHEIGRREMNNWHVATTRAIAVRERAPKNFMDVQHRDFHADPMAVVRRIYDHFGFTLSPDAERRMRQRIGTDPESQHGAHEYTLEQFGLDKGTIRERFADYLRHNDVR